MSNRVIFNSFLIISALTSSISFAGQRWAVDLSRATGHVDFNAVGKPSAIKIHGQGEAPRGRVMIDGSRVSGVVSFNMNSLETGIALRDEHMKNKYLEVQKFPEAKLEITSINLPLRNPASDFSQDEAPFQGRLTIHGVTKPVTGTAKVDKKGGSVSVDANFVTKIADYGIAIPSFAGVTVANDVKVAVSFTAPMTPK